MAENKQQKTAPGRKWYMLALLIFVLGPIVSLYLIGSLITAPKHDITLYIPGTTQINVVYPGRYTLWTEHRSPVKGVEQKTPLEATTLSFTDPKTYKITTIAPKPGWGQTQDGKDHLSLGTLDFDHKGIYKVNTTSAQPLAPQKVYLREPSIFAAIKTLAISLAITALSLITSILLAIIIFSKRISAKSMEQQTEKTEVPTKIGPPATTWAMFCHLSGFLGFIFPLGNIIAPLIIWGLKRHEFPYLSEQGKEAINFQISITIYYIVAAVLVLLVIGLLLLAILTVFQIIAMIIASVESANGRPYKYPLSIRFLR